MVAACVWLAACGWPAMRSPPLDPGQLSSIGGFPDLTDPPGGAPSRWDAAVIVAIEDYKALADRPQARAVADAWYHYLRRTRKLSGGRITLLRDDEATPNSIFAAIELARWQIGKKGTLWFVFIGHVGGGKPDRYGDLWLAAARGLLDAESVVPAELVLSRIGHGMHARGVAVLDGCLPDARDGRPEAGTRTPAFPPFTVMGPQDVIPDIPFSPQIETPALASELAQTIARMHNRLVQFRREPVDLAVFSSGLGPRCTERLPGTAVPALSYLVLGALRGWADRNGDHTVTAVEVLTYVTTVLRALAGTPPAPRPSSYGVDLALARDAVEAGPTVIAAKPPVSAVVAVKSGHPEPIAWTSDTMIGIDRGWFRMGCPRRGKGCEADEKPARRLYLSRFYLAPLEVTQAEYQRCVTSGLCSAPDAARCFVWTSDEFKRGARLPEPLTRPDHPVVCVTWHQAQRYCQSLGQRLPTEAEWERAAVGEQQRRYPWGDAAPTCKRAQQDGCGEHTRPVGSHPAGATPEGVQDLAGNASEWVFDWYARDSYRDMPRHDPSGAAGGVVRGVRGGSYYDSAQTLRSSYRYGLNPDSSFSTVGFRCAR